MVSNEVYRVRYEFDSAMHKKIVHAIVCHSRERAKELRKEIVNHSKTHPDYKVIGIDRLFSGTWDEGEWEEVVI